MVALEVIAVLLLIFAMLYTDSIIVRIIIIVCLWVYVIRSTHKKR
jgi:hypothetical protein